MRIESVTIPTRTVHVQLQNDFMYFLLLSFLQIHVPFRHANHQSSNPSVAYHQDMTKLNTYAQQHSVKTSFSQQSIYLFTNQVNTSGLGFFLDYLCLCCAPFQSLSRRRSSWGIYFLWWSSRPPAACWRARYFCIYRNLLVFSVGNKLESWTSKPYSLQMS